jgi:hypothetical protein
LLVQAEHEVVLRTILFYRTLRKSRLEQLTKAFDFKPVGERTLEGHDVYVLMATPRADFHPPNMETEALKGMQGELWIDKKTFQWV